MLEKTTTQQGRTANGSQSNSPTVRFGRLALILLVFLQSLWQHVWSLCIRLDFDMTNPADIPPSLPNLQATAILDIGDEAVRRLAHTFMVPDQADRVLLQRAHICLCQMVRPVYSVNEWQPVSSTLRDKIGSCSQRMACLEAIARISGIATRVRVLHVSGSFWYPRFPLSRWFIPKRVLLLWPQFWIQHAWVDLDELYSPMALLAAASDGFRNDGESLFDAIRKTPVDFLGKTCGLTCAKPEHDLSKFVLCDQGFFNARDEAFERFGSFQYTLRGRVFEAVYGGRKSS